MSDSKLRELERRWRETKSVDDEAAYLRERVRVGELTQERLELAAYCGHEGARRAAGERPDWHHSSISDWVEGLARWRGSLPCEATLLVCRAALPGWEPTLDGRPSLSEVLRLVDSALAGKSIEPSALWEARESAWAANERACGRAESGQGEQERGSGATAAYLAGAVALLCDAIRDRDKPSCRALAAEAAEFAAQAAGWDEDQFVREVGQPLATRTLRSA